jgi:hypothetical protein
VESARTSGQGRQSREERRFRGARGRLDRAAAATPSASSAAAAAVTGEGALRSPSAAAEREQDQPKSEDQGGHVAQELAGDRRHGCALFSKPRTAGVPRLTNLCARIVNSP